LFPGGIGDIYDIERGEVPIKEWGQHLLQYYDGRFLDDSLFGLSLYNIIQQHTNNNKRLKRIKEENINIIKGNIHQDVESSITNMIMNLNEEGWHARKPTI
jgi:hypothetical protein